MMRKILILMLLGTLILSLAACADKGGSVKSVSSKPENESVAPTSKAEASSSGDSVEKKDPTKAKQESRKKTTQKEVAKATLNESIKTTQKSDGSNDQVTSKATDENADKSSLTGNNTDQTSQTTVSSSSQSEKSEPKSSQKASKPQPKKATPQQTKGQSQPLIAETNLAKRTNQILTVVAGGIHAHITLWTKNGGAWGKSLETNGFVGKYGIGNVHEGSMRTPYGAYSLGFAFGTRNPGTKLPFRQITSKSWWIEDSNDPNYNTWQEGDHFKKPSEHLADYPVQYKYAVVINYNTARTPWAGSGFFVHVSNGSYTAGCVSLPESQMVRLLNTLTPGAYILNVTSEGQIKGF